MNVSFKIHMEIKSIFKEKTVVFTFLIGIKTINNIIWKTKGNM